MTRRYPLSAATCIGLLLALWLCLPDGTFSAPSNGAPRYRLGPNDVIRIQVFGEEDLSLETRIGTDGRINFPLLGDVEAGGRTLQELQEQLTARLAEGYIRHPKLAIHIVRHRNFYVSGEVRSPGGYPYEQGLTLQKAVTLAGGFTEKAAQRDVTLSRIVDGRSEQLSAGLDAPIGPDDTVIVPVMQKFFIAGEVRSPGRYLYEPDLTVQHALSLAGGLTEKADPTGFKLTRLTEAGVETRRVVESVRLLPDDILSVDGQNHKIYVSGEVKMPGGFPYADGLNVQKAIAMAGGVSDKADRARFKVVRKVNGREEVLSVSAQTALRPDDTVLIEEGQRFYISGEVHTPGRYPHEAALTVQKAVSVAGGFTEKADGSRVKITRLTENAVETLVVTAESVILPDDIIVVEPQHARIYVNGEVKNPGAYPFQDGLNVQKVIALAGGFGERADRGRFTVIRMNNGREESSPASLDRLVSAEDTIVVFEGQKFYVTGEVKTPGRYQYEPGVTVQKAITMAGSFTEKADKAELRVSRLSHGAVTTIPIEPDMPIQPDDLIVVPQVKKIYVDGEVKKPGDYPFEKGLTVHKAIAMAGGMTDKASERRMKLLRFINGRQESIRVKLSDQLHPDDILVVPMSIF